MFFMVFAWHFKDVLQPELAQVLVMRTHTVDYKDGIVTCFFSPVAFICTW